MIDKILEFSLRQRGMIVFAAIALVGVGLWSATHLPIDAVPDITGVQVQINTEVPALAAEESEKLVTRPIEIEMAGLPGMEEMRSLTKFGLSQATARGRTFAERACTIAAGRAIETGTDQHWPGRNFLLQRSISPRCEKQ